MSRQAKQNCTLCMYQKYAQDGVTVSQDCRTCIDRAKKAEADKKVSVVAK